MFNTIRNTLSATSVSLLSSKTVLSIHPIAAALALTLHTTTAIYNTNNTNNTINTNTDNNTNTTTTTTITNANNKSKHYRLTSPSTSTSTSTTINPFISSINIRNSAHIIPGDISIAHGGTDQYPNPYDYIVSALAICIKSTILIYINRSSKSSISIPTIDSNNLIIDIELIQPNYRINQFIITITIVSNTDSTNSTILTTSQLEQLLSIANKCPIHQLLAGNTNNQFNINIKQQTTL